MTAPARRGLEDADAAVAAAGKLSEALETTERARGHLYAFHQLTGHADLMLDDVLALLREAGRGELAARVETELVGLDVVPGHWTYQLVEAYDDGYYAASRQLEGDVRDALVAGRRHVFEAEMKARRQAPHGS
ncbi:hypothetical protein JJV70_00050 [Streptomyces sp. JJ66]|uniref:hypothetical protein n=1 Tax=Streptomyces sp. JJ66 TaxID=2803843 RepID=UPI001C568912|nr:hypothetical protein [Streptomyces sp. JJ66]MBW1600518.1 hypothetical protein [Streptomyces sp. JJ66]